MVFKIGDKVVCINNKNMYDNNIILPYIKLYEIYTIDFNYYDETGDYLETIEIKNNIFLSNRFISLLEFRKMKILNIKTRINVKEKTIIT